MGKSLLKFLAIETSIIPTDTAGFDEISQSKSSFKSWLPSLAILVLVAAMLPFANLILPKLVHFDDKANQLLNFASTNEPKDNQLLNGTILYPYYETNGSISFDFLSGNEITKYNVLGKYQISPDSNGLESGTPALISFSVFDDSTELRSIYIQSKNTPELFWQSNIR